MDFKWKKKREKAIVLVCLETKKASSPGLMQEDEAFKKRSALPLLIIGCFFWSITQTRSPKPFDTLSGESLLC